MSFFAYTSLEDPVFHGLTIFERILPIIILIIIIVLLIQYKQFIIRCKKEKMIRYSLASLMLLGELSYMVWNYYHSQYGRVDFFSTLPFHLCSYAIWGIMFSLYLNSKKLYNYVFVFGIISVLALLFPNLNHGLNSFRYYQLYFSHSLILITIIYQYEVHGYFPKFIDLKKSFILLQIIIILSLIINIITGSEFLYIGPGNKPIDFAWDWPWHMIEYEFVMILFFTGTYLYLKQILKKEMR